MLIATWNVNSIRTRLTQVLEWLEIVNPDLLCVQETKVDDPLFPKNEFESKGYHVYFHGQKAYNGVALIAKVPLEDVRSGIKGELPENEETKLLEGQARIISALIEGIRVINVYVPNGSELGSEKYIYKLKWLTTLNRYLNHQSIRLEPTCLLGDFNIALEDKDIYNPAKLSGGIMASKSEREHLVKLLGERFEDIDSNFSPRPKHNWVPPLKQNGISEPNSEEN